MRTVHFPLFLALALSPALFTAPSARAAESANLPPATPWLKGLVEKARKLSATAVEPGTPAEETWKADIKTNVDQILDWDELTQRSLGQEWNKISAAQKKEFSALLREMIEASYMTKIRPLRKKSEKPSDVKIEWKGEKAGDKGEAIVAASVKGPKSTADLQFDLRWLGDKWRVYDVSIDDVSTVRTYRSQFRKLISERGFDGLLERMRNKTAEIRKGLADFNEP